MSDIPFDRLPPGEAEIVEQVTPLIRRMVAGNPGPFTFTGTCSYIVGRGRVAVIDPGPTDDAHVSALLDALRGETVTHVLVTHTHRDHSPAALAIKAATGATIAGCRSYSQRDGSNMGKTGSLDSANDRSYAPDFEMREGDSIAGPEFTLTALETPGHTANHLAFSLEEESALFSGDHVMAWSTSVVAPPDGSMGEYLASLEKLKGRSDRIYWPGHGRPVTDPQHFVHALIHHRGQRERAIFGRISAGDRKIEDIVDHIYEGLDPRLKRAAALSVLAHIEHLIARGLVLTEGQPGLSSHFFQV